MWLNEDYIYVSLRLYTKHYAFIASFSISGEKIMATFLKRKRASYYFKLCFQSYQFRMYKDGMIQMN